jgi:hypothetical protein
VRERLAVRAQVGATVEARQHPLDRGEHVRIVRIGAQKT